MKETLSVEKYLNTIYNECDNTIVINKKLNKCTKKKEKVDDECTTIPGIHDYELLVVNKYNQNQLKIFAKFYKLKVSGNKQQLIDRLFSFLKLSSVAIKIQKVVRGRLQRRYNMYRGPAYFKRDLCTNDSDFLTGDDLKSISLEQFFSYKDEDNFVYGFDIVSLHNLIVKSGKNIKNPYNRNIIPNSVILSVKHLLRISKILKIVVTTEIQDISLDVTSQKSMELRVLDLFQNIDSLGNYSNTQWFVSLNRNKLVKFIRELCDIWEYRAQLSLETKKLICPPYGTPFRNINLSSIVNDQNLENIRKNILDCLEKIVNSGVDKDSRSLGAYYVLAALTLVNEDAAYALPWLFQSVS
jgi:hypothetical protein